MKKAIVLLVLSSFTLACENKDATDDLLIGQWIPESILINGEAISYDGHTACAKDYLLLSEFSSFEIGDYFDDNVEGKVTPVPPCPVHKLYGSYSVTNNELKIFGSSFFQGGLIIEKSATSLKLKKSIDINGDGESDEVIEVFKKI